MYLKHPKSGTPQNGNREHRSLILEVPLRVFLPFQSYTKGVEIHDECREVHWAVLGWSRWDFQCSPNSNPPVAVHAGASSDDAGASTD